TEQPLGAPEGAQSIGSGTRRADGIACLGKHGNGATPFPNCSERWERRVLHPRGRGILICASRGAAEFVTWRGISPQIVGQLLFRKCRATPVEQSRALGDAGAVGQYAANVLTRCGADTVVRANYGIDFAVARTSP